MVLREVGDESGYRNISRICMACALSCQDFDNASEYREVFVLFAFDFTPDLPVLRLCSHLFNKTPGVSVISFESYSSYMFEAT